jgi:tight adherence protein C
LALALFQPTAVSLPLAMAVMGASYWWPDLMLARDVRRRRQRVQATFPGFLDLMATCAQAGHGLYTCLTTVAPHLSGPLGEVFVEVCGQLASGRRLWPALETARQQAALAEVDTFVAAMAEADFLGSPIADTLRNLAQLARTQRRYAMESAIAAMPLKLSVCTVFFFLPPVFVLLVVPNLVAFMVGAW